GKDGYSHNSSGKAALIFDCQASGFELLSDASWKAAIRREFGTAGLPVPNHRLPESSIRYDPYEKNNLAKQLPEKTNDLFDKLMKWTKNNVKETYIPYLNKDYNEQKEERDVPFVNLVEAWKEGENIAEMAN
ncbi:uncharacterized protein METZ01_LOCUS420193, partial [marine metagenome]